MTKLKIDLANSVLEVEGEEAFVERVYSDFKKTLSEKGQKTFPPKIPAIENNKGVVNPVTHTALGEFESLAECLATLGEKKVSDVDITLVAAAYIQEKGKLPSFASQKVNTELKHVGRAPANITNALQASIDSKPQYVMQLQKSGTSRQARKLYKITTEGFKKVGNLFSAGSD